MSYFLSPAWVNTEKLYNSIKLFSSVTIIEAWGSKKGVPWQAIKKISAPLTEDPKKSWILCITFDVYRSREGSQFTSRGRWRFFRGHICSPISQIHRGGYLRWRFFRGHICSPISLIHRGVLIFWWSVREASYFYTSSVGVRIFVCDMLSKKVSKHIFLNFRGF